MKAGRPPVPARIKELAGTLRSDRQKETIDFSPISEVPKPEVWLDNKAKKYFKNLCRLLIDKRLLTDGNVSLVVMMAQEFASYEKATRKIKDDGEVITTQNGYQQPSPWVAIRNQSQRNYRDIASLFGLDPVSASKVAPIKGGDKDPFEEMEKKYK